MKNLSNKFILVAILFGSLIFGDMIRQIYFTPDTTNATVLTENLPLTNGSSIKLELVDGKQLVIVSLEDLKYVTKKKKLMRETVKNIESLFKRIEE